MVSDTEASAGCGLDTIASNKTGTGTVDDDNSADRSSTGSLLNNMACSSMSAASMNVALQKHRIDSTQANPKSHSRPDKTRGDGSDLNLPSALKPALRT